MEGTATEHDSGAPSLVVPSRRGRNRLICKYSWIADQLSAHKKQFASEPEWLRQFRDHHYKALGEESSDLLGIFLCDPMFTSYF